MSLHRACCCLDPCAATPCADFTRGLEDSGADPIDGNVVVSGAKVRVFCSTYALAVAAHTITVTITHTNPAAGCDLNMWPRVNGVDVNWDGGAASVTVNNGDVGPKVKTITVAAGDMIRIIYTGCAPPGDASAITWVCSGCNCNAGNIPDNLVVTPAISAGMAGCGCTFYSPNPSGNAADGVLVPGGDGNCSTTWTHAGGSQTDAPGGVGDGYAWQTYIAMRCDNSGPAYYPSLAGLFPCYVLVRECFAFPSFPPTILWYGYRPLFNGIIGTYTRLAGCDTTGTYTVS